MNKKPILCLYDLDFLYSLNKKSNAKKIKSLEIDNARLKKTAIESARKAKQGAVEHQGEVQEEVLEDFLRRNFEYDQFEPIKKGAKGAPTAANFKRAKQTARKK